MRDPNRIDTVVNALADCWRDFPDLRFGQIIENIASYNKKTESEVWNMEENEWLKCIQKFRDDNKDKYRQP